jgi:hypothetical protein
MWKIVWLQLIMRLSESFTQYCSAFSDIGTVKVPVGVAGPLRVRGTFIGGEFYVPLATTEAALVVWWILLFKISLCTHARNLGVCEQRNSSDQPSWWRHHIVRSPF